MKEVVIFADGDYGGRWLLRCLLYADSNDQKFPWTIRGLYDSSWSRGGLIAERDRAGSILAVVPVDLESEAASGLGKGGCGRKVETKDIVLFGACGEEAKKGSLTTLTVAGAPDPDRGGLGVRRVGRQPLR